MRDLPSSLGDTHDRARRRGVLALLDEQADRLGPRPQAPAGLPEDAPGKLHALH
ncbi:MAG: hypothetical protein M3O70_05975 [Actinomycetota bacterium]|nr:hypothetical protein [Actinomycetota bacterium]